jgi:hypothetical protein
MAHADPIHLTLARMVNPIVARLAGYEEYVNNSFKLYAADVDGYFGKYRQHPAVEFAKKVRASNQIGFDAVMAMAVHLNPPPSLAPRVPFTDQAPDPRWGRDAAEQFAKLLQQFYRDADCERFFRSHRRLWPRRFRAPASTAASRSWNIFSAAESIRTAGPGQG